MENSKITSKQESFQGSGFHYSETERLALITKITKERGISDEEAKRVIEMMELGVQGAQDITVEGKGKKEAGLKTQKQQEDKLMIEERISRTQAAERVRQARIEELTKKLNGEEWQQAA